MPDKNDDVWFKCNDCDLYFQGVEKARKEHLAWGHLVKKRTPIELRLVHKVNEDISQYIPVKVEGDVWNVLSQLLVFKTDEKNKTYFLTKTPLNMPLNNIIKQINHLFPHLSLTKKQLVKLMEQAVLRNTYEEIGRDTIKVFLTLDSWVNLKPKTDKSKLVVTSRAKIKKLIQDESETLETARKTATKWRR